MKNYLIAQPGQKPSLSVDTHLIDGFGVCKHCGHAGELVYHQYQIDDATCQWCGEWQNEEPEMDASSESDPIASINWTLLRKQKEWLLKSESPEAAGLVNLLDSLQDYAVSVGIAREAHVFGNDN